MRNSLFFYIILYNLFCMPAEHTQAGPHNLTSTLESDHQRLSCNAGYKWVLQRAGEPASSLQPQDASTSSREAERFGNTGRVTAPELERLHDALQQKEEQLASYQQNIAELEATRDRCSNHATLSTLPVPCHSHKH